MKALVLSDHSSCFYDQGYLLSSREELLLSFHLLTVVPLFAMSVADSGTMVMSISRPDSGFQCPFCLTPK